MKTIESLSPQETNFKFENILQAIKFITYYQELNFEDITFSDTLIYNAAIRYLVDRKIEPFPGFVPIYKSINNI